VRRSSILRLRDVRLIDVMPLEVRIIVDGNVTKLTHYGIFVSLPEGESGLVHISEIADAFVRDVADYFQVGDPVKVKVLNIDDRGRYELSAKQAEPRQPINPDAPTTPRRAVRSSPQFEDRLSTFMKRSDRRISELKRNRDARRRGRRRR